MASKIICALTWSVPFVTLALAPASALATPQLVFDSWNGDDDDLKVMRAASSSPGSLITITNQSKTISNIAVRVDLNIGGSLKFVIFNHANHELVYVSAPKIFADDGMTWKQSNTFNVPLPSGQYDIGAIATVSAWWQYDEEGAAMGDFVSIAASPNFTNYADPLAGWHVGEGDAAVRLYIESDVCGDGIVNGGEACDDANNDNTDDCIDTCLLASCGDGYTWLGHEHCDDANDDNTDACIDTCEAASCGDGFLWTDYELCDDGNLLNTDTCIDTCVLASCGDGYVGPGEPCDDGNMIDDDTCSNTCVLASCGDGVLQTDEACDDGNLVDDDECTNACTTPVCGDGIVQAEEDCDDANSVANDDCTNTCANPVCGDGIVHANEECDDGDSVNNNECTSDCLLPSCGDRIIQLTESCDDGNEINDDECTNTCMAPACGDHILQADEACDDGNHANGDGCDFNCALESEGTGDETDTGGEAETGGGETGLGAAGVDGEGCSCSVDGDIDRRQSVPLIVFGLGLLGAHRRRRWH